MCITSEPWNRKMRIWSDSNYLLCGLHNKQYLIYIFIPKAKRSYMEFKIQSRKLNWPIVNQQIGVEHIPTSVSVNLKKKTLFTTLSKRVAPFFSFHKNHNYPHHYDPWNWNLNTCAYIILCLGNNLNVPFILCIIEWMVMFIQNVQGIGIGNCSINKNDDEPLLNNLNVKHALTLNYIRYAKWNGCISDCTGEVVVELHFVKPSI